MSNCIGYKGIKYCSFDDYLIVGTNISTNANALIDRNQDHIHIPLEINGTEIKELGQFAFNGCKSLISVLIEARITQIGMFCFAECCKLERITIPNTCLYIMGWGIQTHNSEFTNEANKYKKLEVFFEPNSQISNLGTSNLNFKEYIHIYFSEPVYPTVGEELFVQSNVSIMSPIPFKIAGISSHPYYISKNNGNKGEKILNIFSYLFIMIINS